jgi:hypothetical protein
VIENVVAVVVVVVVAVAVAVVVVAVVVGFFFEVEKKLKWTWEIIKFRVLLSVLKADDVFFVGLPHLATYIFSMNEPELGAGIDGF